MKLETFLFTKYGTIPGVVMSISRDAVADEKAGLIYPIRIALERDWIDVDGVRMPLGAGVALTAEIKTDRRRMIDYLLSPIARYRDESLRESRDIRRACRQRMRIQSPDNVYYGKYIIARICRFFCIFRWSNLGIR